MNELTQKENLMQPRNIRIGMFFLAGLFAYWTISFNSFPALSVLFLFVLFLVGARYKLSWPIMIVAITVVLFRLGNFENISWLTLRALQPVDLIFPIAFLLFIATSFRAIQIWRYENILFDDPDLKKSLPIQNRFPAILSGRWWLIPVSVAVSFLLLNIFPFRESARQEYWIRPTPARLIFLTGFLFFVWYLVRHLFMLAARWTMKPAQAELVVRSAYAKSIWVELVGIEARRAKVLAKKEEKEGNDG